MDNPGLFQMHDVYVEDFFTCMASSQNHERRAM